MGILEADTIEEIGIKEKEEKKIRVPQKNEKTSWNQTLPQKFQHRNKHQDGLHCKILGTILQIDKGVSQINEPKVKEINDDLKDVTPER